MLSFFLRTHVNSVILKMWEKKRQRKQILSVYKVNSRSEGLTHHCLLLSRLAAGELTQVKPIKNNFLSILLLCIEIKSTNQRNNQAKLKYCLETSCTLLIILWIWSKIRFRRLSLMKTWPYKETDGTHICTIPNQTFIFRLNMCIHFYTEIRNEMSTSGH